MQFRKKKIIYLTILGASFVFCTIFIAVLFPELKESKKITAEIMEGVDGATTIYISNQFNWKQTLLYGLIILFIDIIILAIINIIEYLRNKEFNIKLILLSIFILNIIMAFILFPSIAMLSLMINIPLIIIFIMALRKKRQNCI